MGRDDEARPEPPRLTPYALALGTERMEREVFPALREEARARDVDTRDAEAFVLLGSVGTALRELLAAGEAQPAGALLREAGRLLYHGYHFWAADRPLRAAGTELVRRLLDRTAGDGGASGAAPDAPSVGGSGPTPPAPLRPPAPAGYLQLPRNLFWARVEEGGIPEPADGFFWTVAAEEAGAVRRLETLVVLGLRPGRPGFSVLDVTGAVPPGGVPGWAENRARAEGDDFANVLPGGEIEGLYALTTPLEVLKLVELLFREAEHLRVG